MGVDSTMHHAERAQDPAVAPGHPRDAPPRIGLTTYRERAAWGVWDEPADLLPASYADAVAGAGGIAMLLPPLGADAAAVVAVLDGLHGLVLTGGADVDPARYAADRHERTGAPRSDRDAWETALALAALDRKLPLFAICRGMQVLNVALGGSLIQHLPDAVGHEDHSPTPGQHARHEVRLDPGSRIAALIGERATVATYHHQAVDRLADGLTPTGWAADGTVEAVECRGAVGWVLGVQWHPEVHDGAALFEDFVVASATYRAATTSEVR
jgi:putative glutamine amidotransferase